MFRRFFYQFRAHQLASQIRQVRTDLRPLSDSQVIEQYLTDELLNRQAAANTGTYPMSTLYRRVLHHTGPAPKAFYVEKTLQLQRICEQQAALIEAKDELSEALRDHEEQILSTANGLLQALVDQDTNQRADSTIRRN